MNDIIEVFVELGHKLYNFENDVVAQDIMCRAHNDNRWSSKSDICRSIRSISNEMLQKDKLLAWLSQYSVPVHNSQRVLIIMAGNIPLVGFFDLLCVVASGHTAVVKPSTKDSHLITYIIDLLHKIDESMKIEFYDGEPNIDAVIATGGDNANRFFRAKYGDIPSLFRGNRQSIAVLSGTETTEQLSGLADDIFAYSSLGCRNVTKIFAPRGYEISLPNYEVNSKYINNYVQSKAILAMTKTTFIELGNALLVEQDEIPQQLSTISYSYYDNIKEVEEWLYTHDSKLQCVVSESITHSRRVNFGMAQSPSLTDYPDDVDVMIFLQKLG